MIAGTIDRRSVGLAAGQEYNNNRHIPVWLDYRW